MKRKAPSLILILVIIVSGAIYLWETARTPWALVVFVSGLIFKRQLERRVLDPLMEEEKRHWTMVHAEGWAKREHKKLRPNHCPQCKNPA